MHIWMNRWAIQCTQWRNAMEWGSIFTWRRLTKQGSNKFYMLVHRHHRHHRHRHHSHQPKHSHRHHLQTYHHHVHHIHHHHRHHHHNCHYHQFNPPAPAPPPPPQPPRLLLHTGENVEICWDWNLIFYFYAVCMISERLYHTIITYHNIITMTSLQRPLGSTRGFVIPQFPTSHLCWQSGDTERTISTCFQWFHRSKRP